MASKTRRKCPQCGKVWISREGYENNPETVCIRCRGMAITEALKARRAIEKERKNSNRYTNRPSDYSQSRPQATPPYTYQPYGQIWETGGSGGGGGHPHIPMPEPIEVFPQAEEIEPEKPKKARKPRKKKEKPAPPKKRDKWETVKV